MPNDSTPKCYKNNQRKRKGWEKEDKVGERTMTKWEDLGKKRNSGKSKQFSRWGNNTKQFKVKEVERRIMVK